MELNQKLAIVKEWYKIVSATDDNMNKLINMLELNTDSPFCNSIYFLVEAYTKSIQEKINDQENRLFWYMYDNRFGEAKLSINKYIGAISNLEQLTVQIEYDGIA